MDAWAQPQVLRICRYIIAPGSEMSCTDVDAQIAPVAAADINDAHPPSGCPCLKSHSPFPVPL